MAVEFVGMILIQLPISKIIALFQIFTRELKTLFLCLLDGILNVLTGLGGVRTSSTAISVVSHHR